MDLAPEPSKNPDQIESDQLFYTINCAIKEDNAEKRFEYVVEACRLLGKIMPYNRKMVNLFQQRDLFFYLIVLESFNKRPVQILLNAFFDKLKHFTGFIPVYIESFLELAKAAEPENKTLKKKGSTGSVGSIGVMSRVSFSTREISKEIVKFMTHIKLLGLDYFEKFVTGRLELIYKYDQGIDLQKIVEMFILNTESEQIAKRSCEILEKIMQDKVYGELLISNPKRAADAILVAHTNLENIKKAVQTDQELYSWRSPHRKKSVSHSRRRGRSSAGGSSPGGHSDHTSDFSPSIGYGENESPETGPSEEYLPEYLVEKKTIEEIKDIQDPLEEWLFKNEIPLIGENEAAQQFFKVKDNYELFFTFMLEPTLIECTGSFGTHHNEIVELVETKKELMLNTFFKTINYDHLDKLHLKENANQKAYHPYLYRSYKCKQVMCSQKNWEYMTFMFPNLISEFFGKMYSAMRTIFPKVSIPLVLTLLDYFMQVDPDQTVISLIHYNFFFVLLWNIEKTEIRDYLFKLINLPLNPYKLGLTNSVKISKYIKHTDFFVEFITIMTNPEHQVDVRKTETQYKPGKLNKIYDINQNAINNMMNRSKKKLTVRMEGPKFSKDSNNPYILAEEKLGLNSDIDGIMDILKSQAESPDAIKEGTNSYKTSNTSLSLNQSHLRKRTNPDDSVLSDLSLTQKKPKIYPSLLEAYSKLEARLKKQISSEQQPRHKPGSIAELRTQRSSAIETAATSKKESKAVTPRKGSTNSLDNFEAKSNAHAKKEHPEVKMQTLSALNAEAFQELLANLSQAGARDSTSFLHKVLTSRNPSSITSIDKEKRNVSDKKRERTGSVDLSNSFEKMGIKDSIKDPNEQRRNSAKLPSMISDRNDTSISISVSSIFVKNTNNNVFLNIPLEKIQKVPGAKTNRSQFSLRSSENLPPQNEGSKNAARGKKLETRSQSVPSLTAPILTVRSFPSKALDQNTKLPTLYPYQPRKLKLGELEKLSKAPEFTEEVIKQNEALSYPMAEFLYYFIEDYFNNLPDSRLMSKIKIRSTGDLRLLQSIRGTRDHGFFQLILKNYLLKMPKSREETDSSGILCGKITNILLQRLYTFDTLKKIAKNIHDECIKNFVFICKMIIDSAEWKTPKHQRVYLQNFVVHETLGTNRLMLIQTFGFILDNDSETGFQLLSKVPDTLWHAFQIWFIELKHQTMYQKLFLRIYEIVMKHGNEKVLHSVLFKLNFLAELATTYQDICVNGIYLKMLHIDDYLFALKKLVAYISYIEQTRDYLTKTIELLANSSSWNTLRKHLLPERLDSTIGSEFGPKSKKVMKSITTSLNELKVRSPSVPGRIDNSKGKSGATSLKSVSIPNVDDEKRSKSVVKGRPEVRPKVKFADLTAH